MVCNLIEEPPANKIDNAYYLYQLPQQIHHSDHTVYMVIGSKVTNYELATMPVGEESKESEEAQTSTKVAEGM